MTIILYVSLTLILFPELSSNVSLNKGRFSNATIANQNKLYYVIGAD